MIDDTQTIQSIECYEVFEVTLESTRGNLRFWVEGVLIFGFGCLGLVGNTVTVLVLRGYRKNRSFNILIIWCVLDIAKYRLQINR